MGLYPPSEKVAFLKPQKREKKKKKKKRVDI
jgi:hypothetical protein